MLVTDRFIIVNVTEAKRLQPISPSEDLVWRGVESMDVECLSCHGRWVALLAGVETYGAALMVSCPKCGAAESVPERALQDEATR